MNGIRVACAGASLALAIILTSGTSGDAQAAALKRCDDQGRDQVHASDCISPTFPGRDHGICGRGACFRSGHTHTHIHKRKKS